jgi:hypothetical protein
MVVKVVNVFNVNSDPNSGFVAPDQSIEPGIYVQDQFGHYAVAEAEPLPEKTVGRSDEPIATVYNRQDHKLFPGVK